MADDWDVEPRLLSHSVQSHRDSFSRPSEVYKHWFFLAAESGHFWFRIGGGGKAWEGECHAGEWLLCPPGEVLYRRALSRLVFHVAHLQFDSRPSIAGKVAPRDLQRAAANLAALRSASDMPDNLRWKQHLMLDLMRSALWDLQCHRPFQTRDAQMEKVAVWLEAHLTEKISLAAVAEECRLTPVAFTRRFRAATGRVPSEFVLAKRLKRARRLLLETEESLDRIAGHCGLGTGFYLSRQWSKRFGGSPSRFRRENRV